MFLKNFWGSWNRLPFERQYYFTRSWLLQEDEQLPDRKLFWEMFRRLLLVYALGQNRYYRNRLPQGAEHILWIHMTDHVGDSLMRLSPVQMLAERRVDLLASEKATRLFRAGGQFNNVLTLSEDIGCLEECEYDCVILDALHTRPLLTKHRLLKKTPFVSQNDFFHYCRDDYNLTLCSWCRMEYLLGQQVDEIAGRARLIMDQQPENKELLSELNIAAGDTVGITVGGRESYRMYQAWDEVVDHLLRLSPDIRLVLLGSDNGDEPAQEILDRFPGANIINCVNKLRLEETGAVIAGCRLLLCTDGGLLHVANAVATETVCLFAQEYPEFRYVPSDKFRALRAEYDVNTIEPEAVAREVRSAMAGHWQKWNSLAVQTGS